MNRNMMTLIITAIAVACVMWLGWQNCAWHKWYALKLEDQRAFDEPCTLEKLEAGRQRWLKEKVLERRLNMGGLPQPIVREQSK